MTRRKEHVFIDVITILLCLFPLIMALATAIFNGSFDTLDVNAYVAQYSISDELAHKIQSCVSTFGIAYDGSFSSSVFVIMANTMLIYLFRVFVSVLVFLPKFASRLLTLDMGGKS